MDSDSVATWAMFLLNIIVWMLN